jgi:hypothetical protein
MAKKAGQSHQYNTFIEEGFRPRYEYQNLELFLQVRKFSFIAASAVPFK